MYVKLGALRRYDRDVQVVDVSKKIMHNGYIDAPYNYNDIGLLKLSEKYKRIGMMNIKH